ncbi:MAG: rubredoxin [Synechococcales bacterium]|nr:rubredoxin [Synechococcales bacterium]
MSTEAPDSNNLESLSADVAESTPPAAPPDPKQLDRYECRACGYVYEPNKGDGNRIPPGTPFEDLTIAWRCPVCSAPKRQFNNIGPVGNPSGFRENLGYGLGVNTLTPGQKNILIFGGLILGFLFFLSLYGLN